MRLINTKTLKLQQPKALANGYAILSHRWTDDECCYEDFAAGRNTQSMGYQKVQQLCDFVNRSGNSHALKMSTCYRSDVRMLPISQRLVDTSCIHPQWVWVDSCCMLATFSTFEWLPTLCANRKTLDPGIDQRSSAEVSEAVNSMWTYYAQAAICVVYLSDVPALARGHEVVMRHFQSSVWFTRGWTLQELLAPSEVVFCNKDWEIVGRLNEPEITQLVVQRTGIEEIYFGSAAHIHKASIAKRLSWVSRRETTKEEDMTYCLLGLLDVSMSLLYGEGAEKAFLRLQLMLISQTDDESIFTWSGREGRIGRQAIFSPHPRYFEDARYVERITPADPGYISRPPYWATNKGLVFETPARMFTRNYWSQCVEREAKNSTDDCVECCLVSLNCRDTLDPGRRRCTITLHENCLGQTYRIVKRGLELDHQGPLDETGKQIYKRFVIRAQLDRCCSYGCIAFYEACGQSGFNKDGRCSTPLRFVNEVAAAHQSDGVFIQQIQHLSKDHGLNKPIWPTMRLVIALGSNE